MPTIVVCSAGLFILGRFDRFDPSVQRGLILPLATNPLLWGGWNIVWAMLGPPRRALIGWHGIFLAVLLISAGVGFARYFDVPAITPRRGAIVAVPTGIVYYFLWRYGVSWLNSVVRLDVAKESARGRIV